MTRKPAILIMTAALAACGHTAQDLPDRGMAAVNVPVVSRTDFTFDAAAPGGSLPPSEAARLDGWFQGLSVGYGDNIYLDGPYADAARNEVAGVAARYGLLVAPGAPVTQGAVPDGVVRVVVTRSRAFVPDCPDWSRARDLNYNNRSHPNYGCAVNSNLAAMIANPDDLVHGRAGEVNVDPKLGTKAVDAYRNKVLSGISGTVQATGSKGN
ncbi:pilus assembly protein CpaD [Sphingomonas piscis]|uniref:Pilus assembly protein CpaD n=1 Tax=Sphingomonas piscis TaxID=2714943 RepID=A0A6G7YLV9_9SPHN|nr:CpaD family pilus assembly lipoprotein [Sphingomonas piscis]QIK77717.1 pilus assembly protein CpaD [Sphingomonas piscis]